MKIRLDAETLRRIIDAIPHFVFLKDDESNFLLMNRSMAEFYEHDPEDILGAKRFDVNKYTEDIDRYITDDRKVRSEGRSLHQPPERKRSPDGKIHILETVKMPVDIGHGERGVLGVSTDITELQLAREALENEKELLSVTLASIADGIITTDTSGTVTMLNENAAKMIGISSEQVRGSHIHEVFRLNNEQDLSPVRAYLDTVLAESQPVHLDHGVVLKPRRGEELRLSVSVSPIHKKDGSNG